MVLGGQHTVDELAVLLEQFPSFATEVIGSVLRKDGEPSLPSPFRD
jgi:hypothetical protein